jgi:hypothetical protein
MTRTRRFTLPAYGLATAQAAPGEGEEAFTDSNKADENRAFTLARLKAGPHLDPLRADPRFQELAGRIGGGGSPA